MSLGIWSKRPKHLCVCGRYIRWALALCWDCNVKLRETGGAEAVNGETQYPAYQQSA